MSRLFFPSFLPLGDVIHLNFNWVHLLSLYLIFGLFLHVLIYLLTYGFVYV